MMVWISLDASRVDSPSRVKWSGEHIIAFTHEVTYSAPCENSKLANALHTGPLISRRTVRLDANSFSSARNGAVEPPLHWR
eukprot:8233738-Pyramimonas_sp.AAC.1